MYKLVQIGTCISVWEGGYQVTNLNVALELLKHKLREKNPSHIRFSHNSLYILSFFHY